MVQAVCMIGVVVFLVGFANVAQAQTIEPQLGEVSFPSGSFGWNRIHTDAPSRRLDLGVQHLGVPARRSVVPPQLLISRQTQQATQSSTTRQQSWISRHPVLFGTLVGLGGGFAIGYGSGDDGIFDDYTAFANGVFMAPIGAGIGAILGYAARVN
jgi:hypothetical protein